MITREEVLRMAKFAKIKLSATEEPLFQSGLSNILSMVGQLENVDVDNLEPLTSVLQMNLRMRADEAAPQNLKKELFSNVPNKLNQTSESFSYFVVPKMVE